MLEQTYLFQEIHEQPAVLETVLRREEEKVKRLAAEIKARQLTQVVIAARGTSDNAGRYAQYLLGAVNGLIVTLTTPSLFTIYQQPPRLSNALVLGISQSGRGPDIVAVLQEARRQGALTAAITNFPDSELGQVADFVVKLHAGIERSIAATKTYTSQLAAIALLSAILANDAQMLAALHQVPGSVAEALRTAPDIARIAERYRYMRDCVVIGRGYNYATAYELALKLKELTYVIAEPYSSADFLHGPLALIEHGFPAIVIAPSGRMLPEMKRFMQTLKQREAEIVVISDDAETLTMARVALLLPATGPEWLSPFVTIIPGQIFAMHLAHVRDFDVDHPRGLRKVTKTN
ncbi:MAG TPA: SIS domain-containing protein [Anaerolineae bacterium]|nr:SIS domain-containing protein [Anaerolineae bacterium]